MSLWNDFFEAYAPFPDRALHSLLPYIRRLVDEQDMRLVVAMKRAKDGPMGVAHVADAMEMTRDEASELLENWADRLATPAKWTEADIQQMSDDLRYDADGKLIIGGRPVVPFEAVFHE